MYEPAIGDVVVITSGSVETVGEVTGLPGGSTVAVRITEDGHVLYGQTGHFNTGQLSPITFREVKP